MAVLLDDEGGQPTTWWLRYGASAGSVAGAVCGLNHRLPLALAFGLPVARVVALARALAVVQVLAFGQSGRSSNQNESR